MHPDFLERESTSGVRREKNQQQSQVRLNFKVFNDDDNRAKVLDEKQETNFVGGKTEKLAVRKREKAAKKVKMSGSARKK